MSGSPGAFGLTAAELQSAGAELTAREILQQPQVWHDIARLMTEESAALAAFLAPPRAHSQLRTVLTGAGSSAFAGACLAPALSQTLGQRFEAIATTDLVASPSSWLFSDVPTLLVSFARSGNSPESLAALELANHCVARCWHLVITCNAQGALNARARTLPNAHAIVLPEATNDRGFAMTSSFTGMLLAAARAFGLVSADDRRMEALAGLARRVLPERAPLLRALAQGDFDRIVYLGSREHAGLAREAALKMLELTDGRVAAIADSSLGFRHGPKTFLNPRTLVVVFLASDVHARRYDRDLLSELRRERVAGRVVALSAMPAVGGHEDDIVLANGSPGKRELTDLELCLPYALFAQSLALLRSLALGVRPDMPNSAGTVNRVVQGVSIYPFETQP
jgi:tagatose-6-phosphate ketose/aldose isomerase